MDWLDITAVILVISMLVMIALGYKTNKRLTADRDRWKEIARDRDRWKQRCGALREKYRLGVVKRRAREKKRR